MVVLWDRIMYFYDDLVGALHFNFGGMDAINLYVSVVVI